jgi:excinuclease ABC subunit A
MVDAVLALPEDTRLMMLAPVARERKGEFTSRCSMHMQAQGFVRFRIDGQSGRAGRPAHAGEKRETRYRCGGGPAAKVRPDMPSSAWPRSFETALRLAEGRAMALEMDRRRRASMLFNAKFACPHCNYAIGELEPRLFSFNSPMGACPTCDGLGRAKFFRSGARRGLSRACSLASRRHQRLGRAQRAITSACCKAWPKHYEFDVDTAV